jgi:hypothetical protein
MIHQMSGPAPRHGRAEGKHQQADDDHLLAPEVVGGHAEGNLEHRLGQAVGAQRNADQGQVVAAGNGLGVDREHRQDQEQAEHAQREDRRQRSAGANFFAAHGGKAWHAVSGRSRPDATD